MRTNLSQLGYNMPRGCAAGYMPEMNVLVAASDYSHQSNQPLMKNIKVRVAPSPAPVDTRVHRPAYAEIE